MEAILILVGVIVVCGLLLSPFYFFRKKKPINEVSNTPSISWGRGIGLSIIFIIVIGAFVVFLAVKKELQLPSIVEWIIYLVFAGVAGVLYKHGARKVGTK